jgi:hypothetical protein
LTVALLMPATSPDETSSSSGLEAAPLAPAQVHAQQHLRPVLRLGAAGAGLDVDEAVAAIHLAGEHARGRPSHVFDGVIGGIEFHDDLG